MEAQKKKVPIFKRLLPYAGNKAPMLYFAMILSAVSGVLTLMPMVYIHKIVSTIILTGEIQVHMVTKQAVSAAVFAVSGLATYLFSAVLSHIFAFEVEDNIIRLNVRKLINKPLGFFTQVESGKLRNIIIKGAGETHAFLAHHLPNMAMTMITPVVLLVFFLIFDWKLGLASLLPMMIGMGLMRRLMSDDRKEMREVYYTEQANLSAQTVEYVRGIPVVKTFAQSVESFDQLYASIMKVKDAVMKMTMSFRNEMSAFEAIVSSTAFFLVPVALLLIVTGDMREVLGHSVIYLLIGPAFGTFVLRTSTISQYSYLAELALNQIDAILDYEEMSYGDKTSMDGELEFKHVSFSYGDEQVLDDISFKVHKGKTVALVGPSGGGKTTIAQLAARFYDVTEGEILIDGVNIKEYEQTSLMNNISFVFQNAALFKMSLRDNLLIGNEHATEVEIVQALRDSGSQSIIDKLDRGLDTVYGAQGTYLSGGETQRISIARAFLKDAQIMILDEATAFTDPENEKVILDAFQKLSKGKTTLMIAHRLSSVVDADRILLIQGGRIVAEGTHETLLAKAEIYQELWTEYQRSIDWKLGG